jgi:hypothetical protein
VSTESEEDPARELSGWVLFRCIVPNRGDRRQKSRQNSGPSTQGQNLEPPTEGKPRSTTAAPAYHLLRALGCIVTSCKASHRETEQVAGSGLSSSSSEVTDDPMEATFMASSNPNYLPKAPLPSAINL